MHSGQKKSYDIKMHFWKIRLVTLVSFQFHWKNFNRSIDNTTALFKSNVAWREEVTDHYQLHLRPQRIN